MSLDVSKHACVGATKARLSGKTTGHAEYRCEGCRQKIYIVPRSLKEARMVAKRDGKEICIVCITCAEPWMKKIAEEGGMVVGQRSIVEHDVEPIIARHHEDLTRRN